MTLPWGTAEIDRFGDGPPVVVLHRDLGPIGWRALIDELSADWQVHAVTLPGFGGSALPPWARNVSHMAALLGHSLDELGIDGAPVVGLGFGGWVAAELAAFSPGRVGPLALVSPMGLKPAAGEVVDQFLYSARAYAELGVGGAEPLERALAAGSVDDEDAYLDQSREAVTRVAWKPIGHDPALAGLLAAVHRPSLVVWGDADQVVPCATARQWAAVLRTERVQIVEGGAHHVELTHASIVTGAITAFLRETDVKEG